jgi:hypothetical protein
LQLPNETTLDQIHEAITAAAGDVLGDELHKIRESFARECELHDARVREADMRLTAAEAD